MGLSTRLAAVLRALFGPEPGPAADTTQHERRAFDERLREQEERLEMLHAELELARQRAGWQSDDVRGYGTAPESESD